MKEIEIIQPKIDNQVEINNLAKLDLYNHMLYNNNIYNVFIELGEW